MPTEDVGATGSEITRDAVVGGLAGGGFGGLLAGGIAYEGSHGLPAVVRRAVAVPAAVAGAIVGAGLGTLGGGASRWWRGKSVKTAYLSSSGLAARGLKRMRWGARISANGGKALERGEIGKAIKSTQTSLDASRRGISDFGTSRLKAGAMMAGLGKTISRPAAVGRRPQLAQAALRQVPGMSHKVAEECMRSTTLREAMAKLVANNDDLAAAEEEMSSPDKTTPHEPKVIAGGAWLGKKYRRVGAAAGGVWGGMQGAIGGLQLSEGSGPFRVGPALLGAGLGAAAGAGFGAWVGHTAAKNQTKQRQWVRDEARDATKKASPNDDLATAEEELHCKACGSKKPRTKKASFEEIGETEARVADDSNVFMSEEDGSIADALTAVIDPAVFGLASRLQKTASRRD